jgi:hypothetical protein
MVNVVPGEERYVYRTLLELDGIREVYHVFGEYDFVVIIEVEGLTALNSSVDNIRLTRLLARNYDRENAKWLKTSLRSLHRNSARLA